MSADITSIMTSSTDRTQLFHALHQPGPLTLPNAWDVASALIVEAAGAKAVATTSAGVAWSLGAPDGDALSRDLAIDLVARIAKAVRVPVTADIESGFGKNADEVGETVRAVSEAGASGVNIEDGHEGSVRDAQEQKERLAAAREAPRSSTSTPGSTCICAGSATRRTACRSPSTAPGRTSRRGRAASSCPV
ncbi:hypothetical protein GCM10022267_64430 [Lentzea roselyniae]|uniref:Phosphoenolpyruvate phosphomutase n=1 Tax=Lentzea roselyniae TaxID=531940 RepID=A0ABP7BSH6_9PSEU